MSRPFLAAALALAASHAALAADATPLDTLRAVLHSLPTATRNLDASQPVILADLGVWRTLPIRDGRHIFGLQREQESRHKTAAWIVLPCRRSRISAARHRATKPPPGFSAHRK